VNSKIKKSAQLTIIVGIILWVVGFLFAPFLVELVSGFMGMKFVALVLSDVVMTSISLGFLLGICAVCAGVVSTIYSQKQELSTVVFFSSLLFFLFAGGVGVGIKLLRTKNILQLAALPESSFSYGSLSFFSSGSPYVILATIALAYLINSRQRRNNSIANSNHE
jgi:hypothetical protein